MKIRLFITIIVLLACTLGVSSVPAAQVDQGKCVAYDEQKQLMTIEAYNLNFGPDHRFGQPTGKQSVYNLKEAKIGIVPAVGDIMRVAYEEKGNERMAIKVMNVSKQDIMKRK